MWWVLLMLVLVTDAHLVCHQYEPSLGWPDQDRCSTITQIPVTAGTQVTITHSTKGAVTVSLPQHHSYQIRIGRMYHNITHSGNVLWACDYTPCTAMITVQP